MRSGVAGIHLPKESRIKHDPAVNRNPEDLSIFDVESCATAVAVIGPEHGDEFPAALDELGFHPLFVRMILKRVTFERADPLFPAEFHNRDIDRSFPEHLAVVVQITTLHVEVFQPRACLLLFTTVIYGASGLLGSKTSRVDGRVGSDQRPE